MTSESERQKRYPVTPWSAQRLYRPFVLASLGVALTLGFPVGATVLLLPALGASGGLERAIFVQAHGLAQLYGWAGLFVMGMAFHVVPRLRNAPMPFPWPQRLVLALVLAALAFRLAGQYLHDHWTGQALLVASGASLVAASDAFAAVMARTLRLGTIPHTPAEPWLWAGILWATVAGGLHLALTVDMAVRGQALADSALDQAFIHAALVGFIVNFALGVSIRSAAAFLALRPAWAGLRALALGAVNLGAAWQVAAWAAGAGGAWPAPGAGLEAAGLVAFVLAVRVLEPKAHARTYIPGTYARYELFVRAAYCWLLLGALLALAQAIESGLGIQIFPAQVAAPTLHVLALGFVSMLIMGMASRMLPLFEGAELPHHRLMDAAFVGMNLSVGLRVLFGVWHTSIADAGLGVSGILGLLALACFAWPTWRVLRPAAREAYRRRAEAVARVHLERLGMLEAGEKGQQRPS